MQPCRLPHPGEHLRLHPLLCNRWTETKKYGPHERTDQSSPQKIQLSDEEIANLSDTQFKILVIRMPTDMVEYGCKTEEEVKAMQSEIKQNVQGTKSEGKETRTQINSWTRRKKETFNQNRMKKQEFTKNEDRLRNLWNNFKHSNSRIIGLTEGEEGKQETENLFEQIMKENFPSLAKEIDFQEVQEAQRVPKK